MKNLQASPNLHWGKKSLARWKNFLKGIGKPSCFGDILFMKELDMLIAREQCLSGDLSACEVYKMLGGEVTYEYPGSV